MKTEAVFLLTTNRLQTHELSLVSKKFDTKIPQEICIEIFCS